MPGQPTPKFSLCQSLNTTAIMVASFGLLVHKTVDSFGYSFKVPAVSDNTVCYWQLVLRVTYSDATGHRLTSAEETASVAANHVATV